jgi:hypothetical protein
MSSTCTSGRHGLPSDWRRTLPCVNAVPVRLFTTMSGPQPGGIRTPWRSGDNRAETQASSHGGPQREAVQGGAGDQCNHSTDNLRDSENANANVCRDLATPPMGAAA